MSQLLLQKLHLKGPTEVHRQHLGVHVPKVVRGRDKGRPSRVCQILDHDIDEHVAVASVVMELFRLHSRHSWLWMTLKWISTFGS